MAHADGPSSGDKSYRPAATASKPIGSMTRRSLLASAAFLVTTGSATARVVTKVLHRMKPLSSMPSSIA